ncbi:DNA excision repair protein ERCC-6-like [Mus musculus]|uniref:DNA excision repair protein ERCC-6-like n=2 Tax=Mus musculus TaxID=10090 RepID=ERC6L_MOUSE|nr:DNA excision repair protein ERCC-6-like [Mus musculus]Q8BHK9.1 RecName: Full=DNA excision repair protein ERCC-6-like; AltName: Full=ATP-dependent helicase ERCC6-like [Mus musculus]AAH37660.1 Excision repair cross-complementing rodent repair deficiency complementation group 6 - like [Mus musculus]AAN87172.1 excision repair cross-complementing rodent repair deficiency complementation group 6 C-like [Mus musculus]|eukprot:NP_666347.2 DNA excision repair protein ERCC-6-like [Mus musculus]
MEASQGLAEVETLSPQLAESYLRYVQEAKEAAKNGDLEESLKLFNLAKDIFPTKKVMSRIQKLQEALEQLAEEEDDDEFIDVCSSGLLLYRELYEKLFEHQKEGIAFLYSLYKDGRKGGILADDMGLGKTVQIIAFLSGMFDASLVNHVLLIMPTNLINTWVNEFAKWTPGMRVKTFHGSSKSERTRSLTRIQQRNGVVITTYQMLLNNWQQLASFNGQAFVWDYVILDEAHKIKSASTKSAVCARAIPASNRLLLTGTPVQNNLQELWSLFDFACQGSLLGTLKTFKMEYEHPIIRAREKDATPGEKALGLKISENLMEIIKPYFLRRTKEEVQTKKADNPEARLGEKNPAGEAICDMFSLARKNDLIVWIRLLPLQEEIYRKFVSLDHIKELLMETRSPLAELGVLKKLCDHPRLLSARACRLLNLGTATFSAQDENEQEDVSNMNSIDHLPDKTLIQESGKMIFLMSLLERLQDEGHQTLVFSQSIKILNIIERLLKNKHFKTLRIDGTVTHLWEREKRIQLFQQNKEYSVFLLTTQVGGVGLTLTAATRVVIFDPSWNPATDAQAVDRVYRIGQKENVVVYRLITCGTVEEKIYRRQVFKDSLIRQTTGEKKNPFRYFTKQELKELFTVGDLQKSATQMQLQCLHAAQRRSDEKLDEHIAYLHLLGIAGISDHDLMFTRDLSVKEELDMLEDSQYIHQRVQKAQFLVESESQNTVQRQTTGIEETWLKAQEFPSQQKKKGTEFNKPQPQPSRLLTKPTQVEAISSQMASITICDQSAESEPQEHSEVHDVTSLQGSHHFNSTSDAGTIASLPQGAESIGEVSTDSLLSPAKGFAAENDAMQKKGLQASPGQEAPSENLGSFHYLPRESSKASLGPNLDLQDSVVLYHRSPTANENQNLESDVPMIEISDDLSEPPSALQGAQAIEAQLELKEDDPLKSPPQYACDFNLFLEDSADTRQNLSSKFLEHVEKEKSLQSPAANSRAKSALTLSLDSSPKSDEESEVISVKTKSKTRRILSDDEDEDEEDAFKGSHTNSINISPFPFSSVKQFDASTPQSGSNPSRRFFSPKTPGEVNTSLHSRRSLASRRSLINVVLDDVEDMEERLDNSSEEESEPGLSEENNEEEALACTEEQPSGATLASGNKSSNLTMSEPTSPAPQSSPCAPEPSSSDPMPDPPQDLAVEAGNDYESLVARGKELKECGKIQEALNCLVKALDIKSADPEVMLMTLSLYKQLNI